jgi:pimeloyl-ACP methyl ester carboxylesterase
MGALIAEVRVHTPLTSGSPYARRRRNHDMKGLSMAGIAEKHVRLGDSDLRYVRTGTGPTVVLVHTLRTQLDYFLPLIRALGPGLDIVAPDLPGHGRSGAPEVDYTATYFTDAIANFLDACGLKHVVLVGESIGGSIGLALAARKNPRMARVIAINPYDYGRWGGIRRSSPLANVLFTAMILPAVGPIVLAVGTKGIFRKVMEGGVNDPRNLPADLVDELWACGLLPGHKRAFLSLCRLWKTWLAARAGYPAIEMPVTLIYGEHDWSRAEDREANRRVLRGARSLLLEECGHFASLEQPQRIARVIREEVSHNRAA